MMPKVSVIIPVYNTQMYLEKCIDSCVKQTLDDIEIIIINDGSTDGSLEIAEEYASKYDNVRVKSIENSGLSIARNTGLELATGKYVYFLDSDDWIDENCLEECYKLSERNILDVVTFDAKKICEEGAHDFEENFSRCNIVDATKIYTGKEFATCYREGSGILVQAWTFFLRRDFLKAHGISFLPHAIYEDMKYYMDLLIHCRRMMYIPEKFYNRLYRQGSIVATGSSERKLLSFYEISWGILDTIEKADLSAQDKAFWLDHYVSYGIDILVVVVYRSFAYRGIEALISSCYNKIEHWQCKCIEKSLRLLRILPMTMGAISVVLCYIEKVLSTMGVVSDEQRKLVSEIDIYIDEYVSGRLEKLRPLFSDAGKRIGIYGVGNHTRDILKIYEKLIGEIKANLICVDTNRESYVQKFEGIDVVNIRDVYDLDLDGIVISSFIYENEMVVLAEVAVGDTVPIYKLYDGESYPLDAVYENKVAFRRRIMRYKEELNKKRIFLLETPMHTNTGDYLITYAEECFLRKYLPEYEVIKVSVLDFQNNNDNIWGQISITDIIIVNGGGFFGTHWIEGDVLRTVLECFPCNRTIVFPQSLYYEDDKVGQRKAEKICEVIKKHKDLTICYREALSLERGKMMFGNEVEQYLLPDMALLLNGMERTAVRRGIAVCLRKDVESVLTLEQRAKVVEIAKNMSDDVTETSMHWKELILPEDAKGVINEKLDELGQAELVITDALHCMISCALVGTPCIALPNVTGKVGGVYEWIKELPYIRYLESTDGIETVVGAMYQKAASENWRYTLGFTEYEKILEGLININCKENS